MDATATGAATQAPGLQVNLIRWQDWQAANTHIFPSPESWRWFFRRNRAELVAMGALCLLAGRVFVVPSRFEAAAIEIGCRALQKGAEGTDAA